MSIQVLIAEGDPISREVMCRYLRGRGFSVRSTSAGHRALGLFRREAFDVGLLDLQLEGLDSAAVLEATTRRSPPPPIIAVTSEKHIYAAVAALRGGVYEYLTRPLSLEHVEWLIRRAAAVPAASDGETHILYDGAGEAARPLFGFSRSMREVFRAISRAALTASPALLLGEPGTGKQMVARVLHRASPRAAGPFVPFRPGALTADEVAPRLFGADGRKGLLARARGGTLFIDEVSRLGLAVQVQLLQALRGRHGDADPDLDENAPPAVRLVATTAIDLMSRVREGTMDSDFYWFLRALAIRVPPLRERREDILPLARWLLAREAARSGLPRRILAPEAMHWLQQHGWPGNVRELDSVLVRGMAAAPGTVVRLEDLAGPSRKLDEHVDAAPTESFEDLLLNRLRPVVKSFAPGPDGSDLYKLVRETSEKAVITLAMERCNGNQLAAARLLGINRNTLRDKIDKLQIPTRFVRRGQS